MDESSLYVTSVYIADLKSFKLLKRYLEEVYGILKKFAKDKGILEFYADILCFMKLTYIIPKQKTNVRAVNLCTAENA